MYNDSTQYESSIVLRPANDRDLDELRRLAALDSSFVPAGELLVAVAGERPRAAISLSSGEVIADPFSATAELVSMLKIRFEQLPGAKRGRGFRDRLLGGLGPRRPSPHLSPQPPGGLRPEARP